MMRKNLIYGALILCMGLLLGSCSKNDDPKTSELAGTWKLRPTQKEKNLFPMDVVWEAPSDLTLEMMGRKFPASMLSGYLTPMLSNLVGNALQGVTLTSDGKVKTTVYTDAAKKTTAVSEGYATYKDEGNGRLMLYFTDKTFSELKNVDAQTLTQIKAALKDGVPVRYAISGNSARFYLDTETIKAMRNYLPALFSMAGGMPPQVLKGLQAGLANVVEKSTKIELALNVER